MDRRSFFARAAAVGVLPLLGASRPAPKYVPIGLLTAHNPLAPEVDFVTIDGHRIESTHVLRSDDADGWVEYIIDTPHAHGRVVRRTGTVRIHWKPL
jgi:hypothetical protein